MERREFIRKLGIGLATGWTLSRLPWPLPAQAAAPGLRLALLSDAHLRDGDPHQPEARALARAVSEIRALSPPPELVLFAGDLAHRGNSAALELGREILADLPAPVLMVMGEGDGPPEGAGAWPRLFGEPWFSSVLPGLQILGLHTAWGRGPGGVLFRVGEPGRTWLARELARLDPEIPLVLLSHAPLNPIYRPWQQWTLDGPKVAALLAPLRQVLCVHGHAHNTGGSGQVTRARAGNDRGNNSLTENQKPKTENRLLHFSLSATAWPLPQALQGTPALLPAEPESRGCGWGLLAVHPHTFQIQHQVWQA